MNTNYLFFLSSMLISNVCLGMEATGADDAALPQLAVVTRGTEIFICPEGVREDLEKAFARESAEESDEEDEFDIHAACRGNMPPVWDVLVSAERKRELLTILMAHGARINSSAPEKLEMTPLHYACGYIDDPNVLGDLIGYGARVNAIDAEKRTPFSHCLCPTSGSVDPIVQTKAFLVATHQRSAHNQMLKSARALAAAQSAGESAAEVPYSGFNPTSPIMPRAGSSDGAAAADGK